MKTEKEYLFFQESAFGQEFEKILPTIKAIEKLIQKEDSGEFEKEQCAYTCVSYTTLKELLSKFERGACPSKATFIFLLPKLMLLKQGLDKYWGGEISNPFLYKIFLTIKHILSNKSLWDSFFHPDAFSNLNLSIKEKIDDLVEKLNNSLLSYERPFKVLEEKKNQFNVLINPLYQKIQKLTTSLNINELSVLIKDYCQSQERIENYLTQFLVEFEDKTKGYKEEVFLKLEDNSYQKIKLKDFVTKELEALNNVFHEVQKELVKNLSPFIEHYGKEIEETSSAISKIITVQANTNTAIEEKIVKLEIEKANLMKLTEILAQIKKIIDKNNSGEESPLNGYQKKLDLITQNLNNSLEELEINKFILSFNKETLIKKKKEISEKREEAEKRLSALSDKLKLFHENENFSLSKDEEEKLIEEIIQNREVLSSYSELYSMVTEENLTRDPDIVLLKLNFLLNSWEKGALDFQEKKKNLEKIKSERDILRIASNCWEEYKSALFNFSLFSEGLSERVKEAGIGNSPESVFRFYKIELPTGKEDRNTVLNKIQEVGKAIEESYQSFNSLVKENTWYLKYQEKLYAVRDKLYLLASLKEKKEYMEIQIQQRELDSELSKYNTESSFFDDVIKLVSYLEKRDQPYELEKFSCLVNDIENLEKKYILLPYRVEIIENLRSLASPIGQIIANKILDKLNNHITELNTISLSTENASTQLRALNELKKELASESVLEKTLALLKKVEKNFNPQPIEDIKLAVTEIFNKHLDFFKKYSDNLTKKLVLNDQLSIEECTTYLNNFPEFFENNPVLSELSEINVIIQKIKEDKKTLHAKLKRAKLVYGKEAFLAQLSSYFSNRANRFRYKDKLFPSDKILRQNFIKSLEEKLQAYVENEETKNDVIEFISKNVKPNQLEGYRLKPLLLRMKIKLKENIDTNKYPLFSENIPHQALFEELFQRIKELADHADKMKESPEKSAVLGMTAQMRSSIAIMVNEKNGKPSEEDFEDFLEILHSQDDSLVKSRSKAISRFFFNIRDALSKLSFSLGVKLGISKTPTGYAPLFASTKRARYAEEIENAFTNLRGTIEKKK